MDDFRLGSVYRYDPHGEQDSYGSKRQRSRRPKGQAGEQFEPPGEPSEPRDEAVILSPEDETSDIVEDYYTPSSAIQDSAGEDDK